MPIGAPEGTTLDPVITTQNRVLTACEKQDAKVHKKTEASPFTPLLLPFYFAVVQNTKYKDCDPIPPRPVTAPTDGVNTILAVTVPPAVTVTVVGLS